MDTHFEYYITLLAVICEFHKNIPIFVDFVYNAVLAENLKLKIGILYERIINAHLSDWALLPGFKLLLYIKMNHYGNMLFTFNNLF